MVGIACVEDENNLNVDGCILFVDSDAVVEGLCTEMGDYIYLDLDAFILV